MPALGGPFNNLWSYTQKCILKVLNFGGVHSMEQAHSQDLTLFLFYCMHHHRSFWWKTNYYYNLSISKNKYCFKIIYSMSKCLYFSSLMFRLSTVNEHISGIFCIDNIFSCCSSIWTVFNFCIIIKFATDSYCNSFLFYKYGCSTSRL